MNPVKWLMLCTVCFAVVMLLSCNLKPKPRWGKTVTLEKSRGSAKSVEIVVGNGTLVIQGKSSSDGLINIEADIWAEHKEQQKAKEFLKEVDLDVDEGGVFKISLSGPSGASYGADLKLRIPSDLDLKVIKKNGKITIDEWQGAIHVRSNNGEIQIETKGPVDVDTDNGALKISGSSRELDLESDNGKIELELEQIDSKSRIEARTNNGNIILEIPKSAGITLDCKSKRGRIRFEGFSESSSGNEFEGKLNGGGGACRLKTSNGDIKIIGK